MQAHISLPIRGLNYRGPIRPCGVKDVQRPSPKFIPLCFLFRAMVLYPGSCVGTQVRRWEQQGLSRLCCLSLPLPRLLTSLDLEAMLPVSAAVMADEVLGTPQLNVRVELLLRVLYILLLHILSLQREQQATPCWWTLVYSSGSEAIEGPPSTQS